MIRFYTNRELSHKLNINIARWKRWSREFLPPDPLGGLQSGYARQYNRNDAFIVYIGGYLVKDLNFTIPEVRRILLDLEAPFFDMGFLESYDRIPKSHQGIFALIRRYLIFITKAVNASSGNFKLGYSIRGIISEETVDMQNEPIRQIRFIETDSSDANIDGQDKNILPVKVLPISALYDYFSTTFGDPVKSSSNNS